ncbi:hypothetical protein E8E13_005113 [Curvularia kusanoi]|uniref:Uncharacterized protein n=1 Tax=Curvularia kusanoi TaxID=90978 RepID=A0A9P4TGD1_CURKU|nr:hypothetical protein E8E13_005113 [Curvularia kusanoi]
MTSAPLNPLHQGAAPLTEEWKPHYPGLGLPLREYSQSRFEFPFFPIGAHASCYNSQSLPLPVREVAMMSVMDTLTDKAGWHIKINDETVVAQWRAEALAIPNMHWWQLACNTEDESWHLEDYVKVPENIMSGDAFDCCIQELRSKARFFGESGIIPTLDAHAVVAKSDSLVSTPLHESLLACFDMLRADQAGSPDWHPYSGDKVQNLVHPSLFPLVYNRTRGFKYDVVGVEDAISKWSGRGEILVGEEIWDPQGSERLDYDVADPVPPDLWSVNFQWLPSNVAFQADGTVRFTSYINNLHPNKYPRIYRALEGLIETSLPMWDQCLKPVTDSNTVVGPGRNEGRFGVPKDPDDENCQNWDPSDPQLCSEAQINVDTLDRKLLEHDMDVEEGKRYLTNRKWEEVRKPVLPTPSFKDVDYGVKQGQRLFDKFRDSGLQVIVKMASIELTPENPHFSPGSWHVEGQLNESICATVLYYLDSKNVTESSLSFRMQTSLYLVDEEPGFRVGQDAYQWMNSIYGTQFGSGAQGACLQTYGRVQTKEKRLLAFPNTL